MIERIATLRERGPAVSVTLDHATASKACHRRSRQCAKNAPSKPAYSILLATHEIGHELKAMSRWLDEHRDLLGLVTRDLVRVGVKATGRRGLPAEAVPRCDLLKLAFHLEDSASFRAFARLPLSWSPQKSVLQRTISAIPPETWEQINR